MRWCKPSFPLRLIDRILNTLLMLINCNFGSFQFQKCFQWVIIRIFRRIINIFRFIRNIRLVQYFIDRTQSHSRIPRNILNPLPFSITMNRIRLNFDTLALWGLQTFFINVFFTFFRSLFWIKALNTYATAAHMLKEWSTMP